MSPGVTLTWRDFNYWIIELLEYQKGGDYYWDMLQVFSGKFSLPETYRDRLGLQHLKGRKLEKSHRELASSTSQG